MLYDNTENPKHQQHLIHVLELSKDHFPLLVKSQLLQSVCDVLRQTYKQIFVLNIDLILDNDYMIKCFLIMLLIYMYVYLIVCLYML